MSTHFFFKDVLKRSTSKSNIIFISDNAKRAAFVLAFDEIYSFLSLNFPVPDRSSFDIDILFCRFQDLVASDLFSYGGVSINNFLGLHLIGSIMRPSLYIESGFYIGTSILAFSTLESTQEIIAFDPDHSNYLLDNNRLKPNINLYTHDFSQHDFQKENLAHSIVYFDDHINTAERIIQAYNKGLKTLIFDDSTGFSGTMSRLFPSMPSLFFIRNIKSFSVGDEICWSISKPYNSKVLRFLPFFNKPCFYNLKFVLTKELYDLCLEANSLIRFCQKIPDLRDYAYSPKKIVDDSQYIVTLI